MKTTLLIGGIGAAIILLGGVCLYGQLPSTPPQRVSKSAWSTYHNSVLGFSIQYPNDGTYTVSELYHSPLPGSGPFSAQNAPVVGDIVNIGQQLTPQDTVRYVIFVTDDGTILTSMPDSLEHSSDTAINGVVFQKLTEHPVLLASDDYAYAIQHNGRYYVFESKLLTNGPARHTSNNSMFEQMMSSLVFD